jgi:hypothetical protein
MHFILKKPVSLSLISGNKKIFQIPPGSVVWGRARPALLIVLGILKLMLCQIQFRTIFLYIPPGFQSVRTVRPN